jgi:hypothetical protein
VSPFLLFRAAIYNRAADDAGVGVIIKDIDSNCGAAAFQKIQDVL